MINSLRTKRLAITYGWVLMLVSRLSSVSAQEVLIPPIPEQWPAYTQNEMNTNRNTLIKKLKAYDKKVFDFNTRCGFIDKDKTSLIASCQKESDLLDIESEAIDKERDRFLKTFHDNEKIYANDGNTVNAQWVPSGLPKAIDDAMAGLYLNSPAGVSDRVRKGFQAVMTKDWNVARAWFEDALRLDSDNESLKKLIALCDYTPGINPVNKISSEKIPTPAIVAYVPTGDEIKAYWENSRALNNGFYGILPNEASAFSDNFRKYIYSLHDEDLKKFDTYCDYAMEVKSDKNNPLQKFPVITTGTYVPTSQEIEAFQENNRRLKDPNLWLYPMTSPPGGFSEKFKNYTMSLSEAEMKNFLLIQLPTKEDISFLFEFMIPPVSKSKVLGNKN